ncbi:hypothetical protein GIB67_006224 [Kingdonia uniflora]|uniref:Glycosyltransferase n=1 Tax=Kingdonia uniflora TaxID=39325 RepID=A0A7J7P5M7_9MAGN|nr:hypothetical protein GIB67_006224 [Kingdonia uniflora]
MEEGGDCKAHVLVLPQYGQGHINPMLQFSKRLASKGIKVTVATFVSTTKTMKAGSSMITLYPIYDDVTEGSMDGSGGFKAFLDKFQTIASKNLSDFIKTSKHKINCLVHFANMHWAIDIAIDLGIPRAAFFTQSCAAISSYLKLNEELLSSDQSSADPELPAALRVPTLPSMGSESGRFPAILQYILGQFSDMEKADWVLFNSFHELEDEAVKELSKIYSVKTIGPTLPSMYLDKRLEDDIDYGFNLFKPDKDICLNWLNTKETRSVVYVSFGSVAVLNAEQMEELAWGLKQINTSFLWVVRASEKEKLPTNFIEETSEKGLVITWCPQLEVLSHEAVGCFMTHCGWNSTLESVSLGVPMLAMPQFLDQFSDAKFVEEVWGVGLWLKVDTEKCIVTREEIQVCINAVLKGEKKEVIKKNVKKWKELAKKAVDEGGSSDKNIEEFIAQIVANY